MNIGAVEVIITAQNLEWLAAFVHRLVDLRLCASGHISEVRSVYRWQGKVHDKPEGRATLHTRAELVPAIIKLTRDVHPYEVPCVVALPFIAGNPDYLQWIQDETREPA